MPLIPPRLGKLKKVRLLKDSHLLWGGGQDSAVQPPNLCISLFPGSGETVSDACSCYHAVAAPLIPSLIDASLRPSPT
jgi:hypothetical protein